MRSEDLSQISFQMGTSESFFSMFSMGFYLRQIGCATDGMAPLFTHPMAF